MTSRPLRQAGSGRWGTWLRGPWVFVPIIAFWGLSLLRSTLSNGDAAVYLTQIAAHDFRIRTVHLGYLLSLSGWLDLFEWTGLMSQLESLPLTASTGPGAARALAGHLFSLAGGILACLALVRVERALWPGRKPGWAALWWCVGATVLPSFTTTELYSMQWAALLWGLTLWLEGAERRAGLCLALGLLSSPTSLACFPMLWLRSAPRGAWRRLAILTFIPWLAHVGLTWQDYLLGPRGLLLAPAGLSLQEASMSALEQLPHALGLGGLLLLPGMLGCLRAPSTAGSRRLPLVLFLHGIAVLLLVDRYRDVPAHGLTLALAALVMAEGGARVRRFLEVRGAHPAVHLGGSNWLGAALPLALLLLQGLRVDQQVRAERRREAVFAVMGEQLSALRQPSEPVVGGFSAARLYEWYREGRAGSGVTHPVLGWETLNETGAGAYLLERPSYLSSSPSLVIELRPGGILWAQSPRASTGSPSRRIAPP